MLSLLLLVSVVSMACARGPASVIAEAPEVDSKPVNQNQPTFTEVQRTVLNTRCTSCHSEAGRNRGGVNLETYAEVKKNLLMVRESVAAGWMPPASRGPLTAQEKDMLLRWIDQGAPNN